MVLGKLPVLGRPTNFDCSRAMAYCTCSGCGWGLFGHFFSRLSFLFSFSVSLGDWNLSQRAVKPKTNQQFCSMERNSLSNFGRGLPKEHSCEIILKSAHWFKQKMFEVFFLFIALAAILFDGVKWFEQFW